MAEFKKHKRIPCPIPCQFLLPWTRTRLSDPVICTQRQWTRPEPWNSSEQPSYGGISSLAIWQSWFLKIFNHEAVWSCSYGKLVAKGKQASSGGRMSLQLCPSTCTHAQGVGKPWGLGEAFVLWLLWEREHVVSQEGHHAVFKFTIQCNNGCQLFPGSIFTDTR